MIGLVMIVKDEESILDRCLDESLRRLITSWTVVDTGSTDGTREKVQRLLAEIPGGLHQRPWRGYAENVTEAFSLAPKQGWLLRLDADMTVDWHPDLPQWLEDGGDGETDAWNVGIYDQGMFHRLPLLLRGGIEWRWSGAVHEYLDTPDVRCRSLLGLTVIHHRDSKASASPERLDEYLRLLEPGFEDGDPRSTFYYAQTLHEMGRKEEAAKAYRIRAAMGGFEEEAWYAQARAAQIEADLPGLIEAFQRRPWRQEPLMAALNLVQSRGSRDDVLFVEAAEAFQTADRR